MSISRTMTRGASVVLLILALVACGSTGSKSSATTGSKRTTTSGSKSTTSSGAVTTTSQAAGASSSSTIPTPSTVKASGGGAFCGKIADSYNHALGQSVGAARSPEALRKLVEASQQKSEAALSGAPDDLKPDLRVLLDASNQFIAQLARVNFDVTKIPPTATESFSTRSVLAASSRVLAFVSRRCGINLGGGAPSTSTP